MRSRRWLAWLLVAGLSITSTAAQAGTADAPRTAVTRASLRTGTPDRSPPRAIEAKSRGKIALPAGTRAYFAANRPLSLAGKNGGGLQKVLFDAADMIDGEVVSVYTMPEPETEPPQQAGGFRRMGVRVTQEQYQGFYDDESNGRLWAALHSRQEYIKRTPGAADHYRAVSTEYARRIAEDAPAAGAIVWVHDYHLTSTPADLRRELTKAGKAGGSRIGWFSHVPWPERARFHRDFTAQETEDLMSGLLAADALTFQSDTFAENFLNVAEDYLASRSGAARFPGGKVLYSAGGGTISLGGERRAVTVAATPVGLNTRAARKMAQSRETREARRDLRGVLGIADDVRIVASVDRLDYTKGFPQRLDAIKHFFLEHPEFIGKVTFAQIAPGTRDTQSTFVEHDAKVMAQAAELQRFFKTDPTVLAHKRRNGVSADWVPTVLHREAFTSHQVNALYQEADVAWVTSLADGKHLGPDEALMARGAKNPGVLAISDQVGAAQLHREHALLFHPEDRSAAIKVLYDALTMNPDEKKSRWVSAYHTAVANDSGAWASKNLELLLRRN